MYKKSDGSCACGFYLEQGLTWREAADRCYAQGARLPEIYSAADNKAILKLRVIQMFYFVLKRKPCVLFEISYHNYTFELNVRRTKKNTH